MLTSQRSGTRSRQLPRQQRDALLLREFGGLTYDELASRPLGLRLCGRVAALPSTSSAARQASRGLRVALRRVVARRARPPARRRRRRPVAAKVAALGVGAAALGSSAVVVPHVFDNHRPARGPLPAPAAVVQAQARRADRGSPSGPQSRRRRGRPARARPGHAPRGTARRESRRAEARPSRR